jgi:glycyl-tRNA synthetase beta chain
VKKKAAKAPDQASLLIELLTEELPPKSLKQFAEKFASEVENGLRSRDLLTSESVRATFATPRRLAVLIASTLAKAPDKPVEQKLMPVSVARKPDGTWSEAFLKKLGPERAHLVQESSKASPGPDKLIVKLDGKTESYYLSTLARGWDVANAVQRTLQDTIDDLTKSKAMSYQLMDGRTERFVRPVHGLLILHGSKPIRLSNAVLGFEGGTNRTQGHRFLGKGELRIKSADDYEQILERDGCVVADFGVRKERILDALQRKAHGARILQDDALLDEVTALVEWPEVYEGAFSEDFLAVPQECLVLSMRQHQRYFPLAGPDGRLLPRFLVVSNMRTTKPAHIVRGNERVLRARLADAKFFYDQDRRERLAARVPRLASVVYHNKLGSQLERVERIQLLAGKIARDLRDPRADPVLAERAAWLCKADLLTGMVGEFPELQGVMGRYYARHDGEPEPVADAIEQHYWPRFAGDDLPKGKIAAAVAIADKLDTLVGIFGVGLIPTGEKDPYALRRCALGVVRILCEQKLPLDLDELLRVAHRSFAPGKLLDSHAKGDMSFPNYVEVAAFIVDRARSYLRDAGYATLEVEAVLDVAPRPAQYVERLEAVRAFLRLPEAAALAESDKRIRNILSKSGGASVVQPTNEPALKEPAEKQLLGATRLLRQQVESLVRAEKFQDALMVTARIHQPVTKFFDEVRVNVEDEALRTNRFALLHEVGGLTNRVANISKLAA